MFVRVLGFLSRPKLPLSFVPGTVAFSAIPIVHWLRPICRRARPWGKSRPCVVWLTGLSGAGKTTLGQWLIGAFEARGLRAELFDGDVIRQFLPAIGFSRAERDARVKMVAYLASVLERNGVWVVVAMISPYEEARRFARGLCNNFIEVHVATPLIECERRDPKGLYARARRGDIPEFTGIDSPYEIPSDPEIRIDTTRRSVSEVGQQILKRTLIGASANSGEEPHNEIREMWYSRHFRANGMSSAGQARSIRP
jgi:adenylyl-sulfate kinase